MQVTPNYNVGQVGIPTGTKATSKGMIQSQGQAPAQFGGTERLNRALKASPEVRADRVSRAKSLIADPNYPSTGTIRQVANLLASKFTAEPEVD